MKSEKTEVNIPDSKKPSTVIVHKTSFPMMFIKFDGAKICVWSQVMEIYFGDRKKKGYIIGTKAALVESYPSYDEWRLKMHVMF